LCRVLACKVAAPSVVPGRVIGQKRIDQNLGLARLDAKMRNGRATFYFNEIISLVMCPLLEMPHARGRPNTSRPIGPS
jgi:hypothetical protein